MIPGVCTPVVEGNPDPVVGVVLRRSDYPDHAALLEKILLAIDIDLKSEALLMIVNDGDQVNLGHLARQFNIKEIIVFGFNRRRIGFQSHFLPNVRYTTEQFSLMLTFSLDQLQHNKEKKFALWTALKKYHTPNND